MLHSIETKVTFAIEKCGLFGTLVRRAAERRCRLLRLPTRGFVIDAREFVNVVNNDPEPGDAKSRLTPWLTKKAGFLTPPFSLCLHQCLAVISTMKAGRGLWELRNILDFDAARHQIPLTFLPEIVFSWLLY